MKRLLQCLVCLCVSLVCTAASLQKSIPWISYSTTYLVTFPKDHHIQSETLLILPDGTAYLTRIFQIRQKGRTRFKNEKRGPFVMNESVKNWLQKEWPKQIPWIKKGPFYLNPGSKSKGYWLAEMSAHTNETMLSLQLQSTGEGQMVPEEGRYFILFLFWLQEQIWLANEKAQPSLEDFLSFDSLQSDRL